MLQRPLKISCIVGRKAKLRARLHDAGKCIQHFGLNQTALVMPLFGPRIGKQNKNTRQACRRQCRDHFAHVIRIKTDIGEIRIRDPRQQFRHSGNIGFGADMADFAMGLRLPGQVFAGAKTDLEPNVRDVCIEIELRIAAGFRTKGEARQKVFEQPRLSRA